MNKTKESRGIIIKYFSLLNIQGLCPKTVPSSVPFVADMLHDKSQLFLSLTETWLCDQLEAELHIEGYQIYKANRDLSNRSKKGRDSGGVACYVRNDIAADIQVLLSFSNRICECLVLYSKKNNLVVITAYRPPDDIKNGFRSTKVEFSEMSRSISACISEINGTEPNIVILGDFNLPKALWFENVICTEPRSSPSSSKVDKECLEVLVDLTSELCMKQLIFQPTHRQGNTIDLCFTNDDSLVHSYKCLDVLSSVTHHKHIEFASCAELGLASKVEKSKTKKPERPKLAKFNFFSEKTDWFKINQMLESVDWADTFSGLDVDEMVYKLLDICYDTAVRCNVPLKTKQKRKNHITSERRRLMSKRKRAKSCLDNSHKLSRSAKRKLTDKLYKIEKLLMRSYKKTTQYEERKAIDAITTNTKYFYSYAKRKLKVPPSVGPLFDTATDSFISDDTAMAEIFADQFSSVYSSSHVIEESAEDLFPSNLSYLLDDIDLTLQDFIEAISLIKLNSSPGPDGLPGIYLIKCKSIFCVPLLVIWRKCLDNGVTPSQLKIPDVFPLHKDGSKGLASNYRPISSTSHIIKVFEKIIKKKMVDYLDKNSLFNDCQHGFRSSRSCLSQLLCHFEEILSILDSGDFADVIYLDFSKAFDKVNFKVLLNKLKILGIGGKLGRWIYSFLVGRKQRVSVNGHGSTLREVLSGVPQGSVLGPLLFLILIGDINSGVKHSSLRCFADDTRVIKGVNCEDDVKKLQSDLDTVYSWAIANKMCFNDTKFEHLRHTNFNSLDLPNTPYLSSSNVIIKQEEVVKDLGVLVQSNCLFPEHTDKVVSKMKSLSSWVCRTFQTRSKSVMLKLWKSLILPHHDYCSQLWSPHKFSDIEKIEMVQWQFLKKIKNCPSNYWDALKFFNLNSLQRRRERYQVFYCWKVLENMVPPLVSSTGDNILYNELSGRRGRFCSVPQFNKKSKPAMKSIKRNSFASHGSAMFNCLPRSIRDLKDCSIDCFKKEFDNMLMNVPDEPHMKGLSRFRHADSNSLKDMVPFMLNADNINY